MTICLLQWRFGIGCPMNFSQNTCALQCLRTRWTHLCWFCRQNVFIHSICAFHIFIICMFDVLCGVCNFVFCNTVCFDIKVLSYSTLTERTWNIFFCLPKWNSHFCLIWNRCRPFFFHIAFNIIPSNLLESCLFSSFFFLLISALTNAEINWNC